MRIAHPSESATLCLSSDQLVSVLTETSTRIVAELGVVWITIEGETKDHILRPGEAVTLAAGRLVVIQALAAPARVTAFTTRSLRAKAA